MKSSINLKRYRWLLILTSCLLVGIIGWVSLSNYVENKISDKIKSFHATTSFVNVSIFKRSILIGDLKWNSPYDSINGNRHFLNVDTISVTGIHLQEFLLHKKLIIDELIIGSAKIDYNKSIVWKRAERSDSDYRSLVIQRMSFSTIDLLIKTNATTNFSAKIICTFTDIDLKIDLSNNLVYAAHNAEIMAKNIAINKYEGMYSGKIAMLYYNTKEQRIVADSVALVPSFGKYEFAHQLGTQTDRVTLSIPKILIEGVQFKEILDSSFAASKMQIRDFTVVAFRDKRVPRLHERYMPLPMESFIKFPHKIKIDSVIIINARVTVEEIAEKGTKSGVITFEEINASLTGLNNRVQGKRQDHALLQATGLLMGAGKINVLFRLPLDGKSNYKATGSIAKVHFAKLNPVLEPLANIRVESGYLNELTFDFNYTEFTSKGILEIDYQDLHLTGLDKNHPSPNSIKTLLLNVIVRHHRNQYMVSSRRTGTIDIRRNRQRSIFNLWWKSIRDGLKSIVFRTGKKNHAKLRRERLVRKELQ